MKDSRNAWYIKVSSLLILCYALFQVQHQGVLEVQVPSDHTSVADIIQVLEEMKDGGAIQNYSVSQTTLDDVSIQVSGITWKTLVFLVAF